MEEERIQGKVIHSFDDSDIVRCHEEWVVLFMPLFGKGT